MSLLIKRKKMKDKIIAVFGVTGVGKTGFSLKLAKEFNGEVVCFDSRQVYKKMDIVTGKDLKGGMFNKVGSLGGYYEVEGVRIWGVDFIYPDENFSGGDFKKKVVEIIEDIFKRGKIVVLTVGTYFYFKVVFEKIDSCGVKPDWEFREEIEDLDVEKLREMLGDIDEERLCGMNNSDRNNKRRLIRAIEVGRRKKEGEDCGDEVRELDYEVIKIGLRADKKEIEKRIGKRVDERVKEGAFEEMEALISCGYNWDLASMTGIGYRQLKDFFEGKVGKAGVLERWKKEEIKYVKSQEGWLRKDEEIKFFDRGDKEWSERAILYIRKRLA